MEPVCNLYRINTYLDAGDITQGLAIGDVVSVDEDSDFPYCNIHTRGLCYPLRATQLEPLTQQEVDDLFEPQAPTKHEFTYGQRVLREVWTPNPRYYVGKDAEGCIMTTLTDPTKSCIFKVCTWSYEQSQDIVPYVEPKVKITAERLDGVYGKGKWELNLNDLRFA